MDYSLLMNDLSKIPAVKQFDTSSFINAVSSMAILENVTTLCKTFPTARGTGSRLSETTRKD
jgi:hypothetical protein